MATVLKGLGIVMAGFLVFVGLLHVVLIARGRYDRDSLAAFHDWPVLGGFFPKQTATVSPQSAEDRREAEATAWLKDSRNEFKLPPGFTVEQLEALVRELKDAKTQAEAARAKYEAEAADLERARKEVETNRQALNSTADSLLQTADSLKANRDELDRYRTFVSQEEIKNFKTLASMYQSMPADEAAKKLDGLDVDVVAKVISRMSDQKKAGRLLAAMETPKAVAITKRLQALTDAPAASKAR